MLAIRNRQPLQASKSKSEIAKCLGVDRSTVYREIRRNSINGYYRSSTAELLVMARQHEGRKHYRYGQQSWDEVCCMLTSDNGKEFACYEKIAKKLKVKFFFARPYCSYERDANENMNGLIRQYFPKGTGFGNITPEDV